MTETATAPCERCPLQVSRAVAARGPVPARLLLLSGAPRYHEEREGVAFASPAFTWLEETLAKAGLNPSSVHYATLTGCRPPHQRPVRAEEIAACAPRLDVAIDAVAPEAIVLCGPDAVAALLPGVALGTAHGRVVAHGRRRYFPIRHPYAALHCRRYVEEVVSDLHRLAALLADAQLTAGVPLDEVASPQHLSPSGRRMAQEAAPVNEATPAAETGLATTPAAEGSEPATPTTRERESGGVDRADADNVAGTGQLALF